MRFAAIETRARLVLLLFASILVITIAVTLLLYAQDRRELREQNLRQLKLEAVTVSSLLLSSQTPPTEASITKILEQRGFQGSAGIFDENGTLIATASAGKRAVPQHLINARRPTGPGTAENAAEPPTFANTTTRTEAGFDFAEASLPPRRLLVLARATDVSPPPAIFYVFGYQIISIVAGLIFVLFLIRWLFRPYRRLVEAARGSPVKAASYKSEGEFVVETFQALVEKLQSKEKELAALHTLERNRADRSERFNERLIVNIPSGLVTVDSRGLVTAANAQAIEIFANTDRNPNRNGNPIREPGMHALSVNYETFFASAPRLREMVEDCLKNGISLRREEVDVLLPDGRTRHLGLSLSPILDDSHRIEGALCLMTDITEVIELRERMKLQENLANLGEMAAGLAHEFKNSLHAIQGYAQLLESQIGNVSVKQSQQKTVDGMLNEVRLLARLVTDFLNFARPQQMNLAPVELDSLVRESADEVAPLMEEMGIELRISGDFPTITGDESLLRRVFLNLLRNAAEAIDPASDRKTIEVSGTVDSGEGGRYAHIRVRDTGSGISPEDLHKVFIPFYTTKSRGYGIGLAIVQKILIAHGGDVTVESSDPTGTQFHCRLSLQLRSPME